MMKISILTLFPEMFSPLQTSILGKASEKGLIDIQIINIRDFSTDKHKKCDDYPFGGGPGMLMMVQPIYDAMLSIDGYEKARKIYLSPKGRVFNQSMVPSMAQEEHIIFLCGHYEGVDQRVLEIFNFEEMSIGDYVLTGGELPAMVVIDSILRFVPGVLGSEESTGEESFSAGLLEHMQYTRPQDFMGYKVPEVLLSGNHAKIDEWRKEQSLLHTKKYRPDLLEEQNG